MGEHTNDHLDSLAEMNFTAGREGSVQKAAENLNGMLEAIRAPMRGSTTAAKYPFGVSVGEIETPGWNAFWPVVVFKLVGGAAETAAHLSPLIADRTNHDTGLTGGAWALRPPNEDVPLVCFVSVTEDTLAQNDYGVAIPMISGPYFVEVDVAVKVHDSVGALDGDVTFMKDVPGYRVLAYHSINAKHYASVYRDISVLLKSKDDPGDPGADQQTFNTADADGTAGTQDMIGDVPGS